MLTKKITVNLKNGLEARPVAMLVQVASRFNSKVYLECADKKVNAKSLIGMMTLGVVNGEEITVQTEGEDEENAMSEVSGFLIGE
ncbi:MAG: HPr family phosphocarrier protein [Lachnospiraceae bacterium]|nr:HPr family phosphocarrier protein [Lachnospiraceae bacterium]